MFHLRKQSKSQGFGAALLIMILLAVLLIGFVGWRVYDAHRLSTAGSPKPTTTKLEVKPTSVSPYAGWKAYASSQEGLSFEYPGTWTTADAPSLLPGGDGITIKSPNGTTVDWQSALTGLGGACNHSQDPHVFVRVVQALSALPGAYIVELSTGSRTTINHIGIVNRIGGLPPRIGDTGECLVYTTFKSKDDQRDMWLQARNAIGSLSSSDISIIKLILQSAHY